MIVSQLGGPNQLVQPYLLRYYLRRAGESPEVAARLTDRADSFPAAAAAAAAGDRQITVRLRISQLDAAKRAARAVGLKMGDLLRGAVALAADDGGITYRDDRGKVVKPSPDPAELKRFAAMKEITEML